MHDSQSWIDKLLEELGKSGPTGRASERYLRDRKIRVGVRSQSSGARWTLVRRIDLSPRYLQGPPQAPYALGLVVHEVQHLKQGPVRALSVYGELEAWHAQFRFLLEIAGGYPGVPGDTMAIRQLMQLPLAWDRSVLKAARGWMRQYAGRRYRVDLLPLYPLHREVLYGLFRRRPDAAPIR